MSRSGSKSRNRSKSQGRSPNRPPANTQAKTQGKGAAQGKGNAQAKGGARGKGPDRARAVAAERLAKQKAAERRQRALLASLVAVAVLGVAAIIGFAVYTTQKKPPSDFAVPKNADKTSALVGKSDAKVTVEVYLDYQCPVCKEFEQNAGSTLQKFVDDGTVKVKYHPVAYLNRFSSTNYSTRSSAASGCASDANVYSAFTTELYNNQPPENGDGLTNDKMVELGKKAGATSSDFAKCVKDQKYADWTASLTEAASKRGVQGTPTVYVNGTQLQNPNKDTLSAAIQKAAAGG